MENENPFKKIGLPPQEVPKELKQKVMDDVNAVKFIMEVTSLFSSNYASTVESMFKTKNKNNNNDTNK
ncbi:hypothetical protein SAMN05443667_101385 [Flavobacterium gillisiae]|uniref:Uncharacterized protein n=1 Tax=Flavobacterium gillisiae TaxID=150146 RepID=A0A1H3X523_9FLAO|nr:hypothetical protein [Flavobacterium gillisiae]SDZ94519.1 hypothetical protein SAMN05443667_101385 [Flavobacterium gillisiae]